MQNLINLHKELSGKVKAVLLIWIFFQMVLFLMGGGAHASNRKFFPLYSIDIRIYDLSEFIIYSLLPIIYIVVKRLWKSDSKIDSDNHVPKNLKFLKLFGIFVTKRSIQNSSIEWSKDLILKTLNSTYRPWYTASAWRILIQKANEFGITKEEIKDMTIRSYFEIDSRKLSPLGRIVGRKIVIYPIFFLLYIILAFSVEFIGTLISIIIGLVILVFFIVWSYYYEY